MKTLAAVLRAGDAPFSIEEVELAEPRADEVLVRNVAVGMCHTDLLAREMPPEMFLGAIVNGHEGAGVVEAVGSDVTSVAPGDHVVLSFNSCGDCPSCAAARLPYCYDFSLYNMSGGRADGSSALVDAQGERVGSHYFGQSSFAAHSVVAERSVVKVDAGYELKQLGPLGCGIQTGAGAILNSLSLQPGQSVVIAGAGALGLSAVMAAKAVGAETIIAIDRHESRLELATRYGATHTLTGDLDTFAEQIMAATGTGADHGFDTTGNAAVTRAVFDGLGPIGVLGLAGVGFGEVSFPQISLIGGRTVRGIMEGDSVPQEFIPKLAAMNAAGEFPFHELITEFNFADINAAEAASASGEVIKPVLVFE